MTRSKDVRSRYQSVVELVTALTHFAPPLTRARIERIQRIAGVAPRPPEGSVAQPFKSSSVGVHSTHGTTGHPSSQQGFHTPPPMSGPPGYAQTPPHLHGGANIPTGQPMQAPLAYTQPSPPGIQPYGMTGADITGYQPGPMQQSYGGGAFPPAPPPKGPSVLLVLIIAGLVIAILAGVMFCGFCAVRGA